MYNLSMNKFLGIHNLPKLNHKEIEKVNPPITRKETESVLTSFPTKSPEPNGFTGEFYQTFKEEFRPPLFFKTQKRREFLTLFIRIGLSWYRNQTKMPQKPKTTYLFKIINSAKLQHTKST